LSGRARNSPAAVSGLATHRNSITRRFGRTAQRALAEGHRAWRVERASLEACVLEAAAAAADEEEADEEEEEEGHVDGVTTTSAPQLAMIRAEAEAEAEAEAVSLREVRGSVVACCCGVARPRWIISAQWPAVSSVLMRWF
jgi:hypothetical protein